MKIRYGFVSNSSSSSYIVIGDTPYFPQLNSDNLSIPKSFRGETRFGWGPDTLDDFGSRLNFAYLQALIVDNHDWLDMLSEVICDKTTINYIDYSELKEMYENLGKFDAYIDHKSSSIEDKNIEIFESKKNLINFLFSTNSKIVLDNNNH